MTDAQRAGAFWDREIDQQSYLSWMAHPLVRDYINRSVDESGSGWPLDWFQRRFEGRRFRRALSIGCGAGAFERDLVRRNIADQVIGVDASLHSLSIARSEAIAEGLHDRIRYVALDFNRIAFPHGEHFDFVAFHQSAHHVAALENAYAALLEAMERDSVLYLDEYIGPSRFEWNAHQLRVLRSVYSAIPRGFRTDDELPRPLAAADPSEAIRSSEIVPLLKVGFEVKEFRPYGGNLLSVVYPKLRWRAISDREEFVRFLIDTEKALLQMRGVEPFHAIIVASPRSGIDRQRALRRYRWSPSRLAFMLRRRLRSSAFPPVAGHH